MVTRPFRRSRPTDTVPAASRAEKRRISAILRKETVGGVLLVAMAALALIWANSPWSESYFALRDLEIGYEPWHLKLSLGAWAADGLLAIFFFLVGLELKREFVAGDLRRPSTAITPVVAAIGGVLAPVVIYLAITGDSAAAARGWAIPTATDIAFAVAVLALVGSRLPSSLRIFLLTLAVVDDLIAISIIAIAYTASIDLIPLVLAFIVIAVYAFIAQRYRRSLHLHPSAAWLILLPLGFVAWALVHASGIHATIAGVLLGFTIPVLHRKTDRHPDAGPGLAETFEHRFRPLSAGIAVPIFAFFSAGVAIGGADGLATAFTDPVVPGIIVALVAGKPLGIVLATWLVTRFRQINLDPQLRWVDITAVGLLAGIGFTVSLLVAELSFAAGTPEHDHAKIAILTASILAALIASALLIPRNRAHARKTQQRSSESSGGQ